MGHIQRMNSNERAKKIMKNTDGRLEGPDVGWMMWWRISED
jgi:hypothetical protein